MRILIDNQEVVCSKNFTITQEMLSSPSVILNNVYPKAWEEDKEYTERFYYPKDYSKCLIYNDEDELIFSGVVENTGEISLNPRDPHYCNIQVLDFKTFLSEGETLDYVIVNKTITEAIETVVNSVSDYGFEVGEIKILNPDDELGAYSTKDKTAYDVLQYFADITQSRWFTRMIDENRVAVDFYDPTLMVKGTEIKYTQEFFEEQDIHDMSFSYASRDYRNKQIMTSEEVYGSAIQKETIIANGYQTQYNTFEKLGVIQNLKVNGVNKTTATNQEKEAGVVADFYYTPGEKELESETALPVGSVMVVEYTPIVQGRQVMINAGEISRISNATNRKGTISRYENRNDATTTYELQQIGKSYLKYKGSPEITLTVTTNKNIWNIGETVDFDAPIDELNTDYMVKKKEMEFIANLGIIFYKFELSSSYNSEQAINYFDNQRAKNNGNIGEGETISRNIEIENEANIIFYNTEITEITTEGTNALNSVLNAPFVV